MARTLRTLFAILLLQIAAAALLSVGAPAAERSLTLAGLTVTVWQPEAASAGASPVIIFSHGFHGCGTHARFLGTAFAAAGYAVFAPNHRDASCGGGGALPTEPPELPFREPAAWSPATYRDRADDIGRLIAAFKADAGWQRRLDWTRLGLVGHSLGGYTVLGLGGAWPQWKLDGVKAVLALSPYSQPFVVQRTLPSLAAPVMFQGGTRDLGITPALRRPMGAYDQSPSPKYYVEIDAAGHLAWTDLQRQTHATIIAYSLAFMNRYLTGAEADPVLSHAAAGVADLRYALEPAAPARQRGSSP